MKLYAIAAILLFQSTSYANKDSVGVFYKPEKVIVLVNEKRGAPRLNGFMNAVGAGDSFVYETDDKTFRINCGRNIEESTCTFRLLNGSKIGQIQTRRVEAFIPASEIKVHANYKMYFESSMGDKFLLETTEQGISYTGSKKQL